MTETDMALLARSVGNPNEYWGLLRFGDGSGDLALYAIAPGQLPARIFGFPVSAAYRFPTGVFVEPD